VAAAERRIVRCDCPERTTSTRTRWTNGRGAVSRGAPAVGGPNPLREAFSSQPIVGAMGTSSRPSPQYFLPCVPYM